MSATREQLGTMSSAVATAEAARQAVSRLEQLTRRRDAVNSPAQAYQLMGVLAQLGQSLGRSVDQLGSWWVIHDHTHQLEVGQGPFADDPAAAVATTIQSLTAAAAACAELTSALERAQMCSSDLSYTQPPRSVPVSRTHRRWSRQR